MVVREECDCCLVASHTVDDDLGACSAVVDEVACLLNLNLKSLLSGCTNRSLRVRLLIVAILSYLMSSCFRSDIKHRADESAFLVIECETALLISSLRNAFWDFADYKDACR